MYPRFDAAEAVVLGRARLSGGQATTTTARLALIGAGGPRTRVSRDCGHGARPRRFGKRTRRFGKRTRRFGKRTRRFGKRTRRFGKRTRRFGKRTRRFGKRTRRFGKRTRRFGKRTRRFGAPSALRPREAVSR